MVTPKTPPYYKLSDLIEACTLRTKVSIRSKALEDAKKFGLETAIKIKEFVANGEFDEITHVSTGELNHPPDMGVTYDAYEFRLGPRYVYFAFYVRQNGMWIIKSFHEPEKGNHSVPLSHNPFLSLMEGR